MGRKVVVAPFLFGIFLSWICSAPEAVAWTSAKIPCNHLARLSPLQPRRMKSGADGHKMCTPYLPRRRRRGSLSFAHGEGINRSAHGKSTSSLVAADPKRGTVFKRVINFITLTLRQILWPGLSRGFDPDMEAPLPQMAPLRCPFFGNNILAGSKKKGPEYFYSEASAKLGHPRIWRFYFMGYPVITVSGADNVNAVLQSKKFTVASFESGARDDEQEAKEMRKRRKRASLFSSNSVLFESNRTKHQFLRRLIGAAFTPQSVQSGIPKIVDAAREQMRRIQPGQTIVMEDVCEKFTLDIAWRQLIGLNLISEEEIERFQKAVETYVSGVFSPSAYLNLPWKTLTPPYRARNYLVSKIEERITELESNGPDDTTMSSMIFSSDEDSNKKLSREDVIENALILLIAGTETTASTLTSATFFLGLHPRVFEKLGQEQQTLMSTRGKEASLQHLEECTYLDAVIRETMRLVPVSGTNLRTNTEEGFVLDGKQGPKKATVFCNIRLTHELDPTAKFSMDPRFHFEPERWLESSTRPSADYLPFGTGSRRCLGAPLALAEMRVFLAMLARTVNKFELLGVGGSAEPGILWKSASIIPKPVDGVPIAATEVAFTETRSY